MRYRSLLATALVAASAAACGSNGPEQEDVTVPGEGPTYLGDSAATTPTPPMATTPGAPPVVGTDSLARRDSAPPP